MDLAAVRMEDIWEVHASQFLSLLNRWSINIHESNICSYTCNINYQRVGPKQINCIKDKDENGIWDNTPPICKGMFLYTKLKLA